MKRFILFIALTAGIAGCASGRPLTSADGRETRSEKSERTAAEIDSLVQAQNFQFVATEVQTQTSGIVTIRGFESTKVLPERLLANMTGTHVEGFFLGDTAYDRIEQQGNKWLITIEMDYQTGKMTFNFEIDRNTANAILKVSTNRAFEVKTYRGYIVPN